MRQVKFTSLNWNWHVHSQIPKCPKIVVLVIQHLLKKFTYILILWKWGIFNTVGSPFKFKTDSLRKIQIIQPNTWIRPCEIWIIKPSVLSSLKIHFQKSRVSQSFCGKNDVMLIPILRNYSLKCLAMFRIIYFCEKSVSH